MTPREANDNSHFLFAPQFLYLWWHPNTNVGKPTLNFHARRSFPFSVAKITRFILGPLAIGQAYSTFVGSSSPDETAATTATTRQRIVAANNSQVQS